jgi:hypothetical protein
VPRNTGVMTREQGASASAVHSQLQLIYDLMKTEEAWPTYETVDLQFDRELGIEDSADALAELAPRYLWLPAQSWGPSNSDQIRLTLAGILECSGGSNDLQLLVEFIRWGTELERHLPGGEQPVLSSVDFAEYSRLEIAADSPVAPADSRAEVDRGTLARLGVLVELLPNFWSGIGSAAQWNWRLTLDRRRFRPYRAVHNLEQLFTIVEQLDVSSQLQQNAQTAADLSANADVEQESGTELSDTSAGSIDSPFDPDRIDVATRSPTVSLLLSRIRRGSLDLQPEFQRNAGIWPEENQSRLIESMLLRIPLPTFYAAESRDDNWSIIDGVQRLTTIARFIEPESIGRGGDPLVLRRLQYLGRQYEGKTFADLPGRLQTRLLETELVVHLIRPGTPDQVMFNIFARINTGGRPLTRQELRHALIPGPARDILRDLAESEPFLRATLGSVSAKRMDDREMTLRFIAFRDTSPEDYRPEFDSFLVLAMKWLNGLGAPGVSVLTNDFYRAMDAAHQIFGDHAFRKRYPGQVRRSPINKALFESVAVNLAELSAEDIEILTGRGSKVLDRFSDLLEGDPEFDQSISVATGDAKKVRLRFNRIRSLFEDLLHD